MLGNEVRHLARDSRRPRWLAPFPEPTDLIPFLGQCINEQAAKPIDLPDHPPGLAEAVAVDGNLSSRYHALNTRR